MSTCILIHPKSGWGAHLALMMMVELGGYAGAEPERTAPWFEQRLEGMRLVEVRGRIKLADEDIDMEPEEAAGKSEGTDEEEER